jgi:hypothetical protein
LTYSVHAASTVLAVATMRSRRNLLDEIDASTLRLIRSRTRRTGARRVGSCDGARRSACGLPVDAMRRNVTASAILSADRWAPRASRARVRRRINVGLSQRTRGGPEGVSPREPSYCITLSGGGQQRVGEGATGCKIWSGDRPRRQRMLPF